MWLVQTEMCYKYKMHSEFWKNSLQRISILIFISITHWNDNFRFWIKWNILLKLIFQISFYFLKMWLLGKFKLYMWLTFYLYWTVRIKKERMPCGSFQIGGALAAGATCWEKSEGGSWSCSDPCWALTSDCNVPLFSQDNGPSVWGPWVVAEGPGGTHQTRPGAPGQEQARGLLSWAPGELPSGAGATGWAGPPHDLCGPVGSGAGVHAARTGRAPAHARRSLCAQVRAAL